MKKIGVFLLTLAAAFSFTACKKKKKTTANNVTTEEKNAYITPDVEGNLIENGNFNTGEREIADSGDELIKTETGEWWLYGLNGGGGQFEINDKRQLEVGVRQTGKVMHGCQLAYDGFALIKGNKYVFEFDAFASENRHMEVRIQYNGSGYENYLLEGKSGDLVVGLTTEMQHYKFEFTSSVTDPAPRMAINLGWFEGDTEYTKENGYPIQMELVVDPETGITNTIFTPYEIITFDNFVLKCTYDSGETIDYLHLDERNSVRLNQVGYHTSQTKEAVFIGDIATLDTTFKIYDVVNETYYQKLNTYTGQMQDVSFSIKKLGTNTSSGEYVGIGDFTNFDVPGTYKLIGNKGAESFEFTISEDVYDDLFSDTLLMLYKQRCGLVEGETGDKFSHAACHQDLATIYGTTTKIDVSGGWHDAGDYGKYVVPGAQTVADLLLTYQMGVSYSYPSYVSTNDLSIPDILEEAMWELDWMLKMQDSTTGGVYHKVSTKQFPEINVPAVNDTAELFVSPISYAATADFAAVMAMANVVLSKEGIAPTKAALYLEASKKAYAALANMDQDSFKNPSDIKTGEYPDSDLDDELAWASISLYLATGTESYLTAFNNSFDDSTDLGFGWANMNGFAAYIAVKVANDDGNDALYAKLEKLFLDYADKLVAYSKEDAYNVTVGTKEVDGKEVYAFEWGSNLTVAGNGRVLAIALDFTINSTDEETMAKTNTYKKVMEEQLNYLLGENACCYCFVTGYGSFSPKNPHHRPSIIAEEPMVGMLIGGPDSNFKENGDDSIAKRYCAGHAAAHCYVDHNNSWSTNEITIYWNSPLTYLIAAVDRVNSLT